MPLIQHGEPWRPTAARQVRVPGFVLTTGHHPAGSRLPRHTHDDPTICYVLAGGFTEASGGREADCPPGTLKLMPAGEPHSNRFDRVETRGLRIDVDRSRFGDLPEVARALDERRQVRGGVEGELARRLVGALDAADDAGRLAAEGLALELVAMLARAPAARVSRRPPAWLVAAQELVQESFVAPPPVSRIAELVGVHPATLARGWRQHHGCTIGERIRLLRLERAARLLASTHDPLSVVAQAAGFYDQSHLTNRFRRHYGVTPAAYRAGTR
jgi:AraC-like DNA-binding protein